MLGRIQVTPVADFTSLDEIVSETHLSDKEKSPANKEEKYGSSKTNAYNAHRTTLTLATINLKPIRPWFLIHPQSPQRVTWDVILMVLLLYVSVLTPLRIGYEWDATGTSLTAELIIDILFCVDVLFNFRTSHFKSDGSEETDWIPVATSYLKGFFLIDIVSSVPFDVVMGGSESADSAGNLQAAKTMKAGKILKVSRVLKITKLMRLFRMKKMMERMEDYIIVGRNGLKLVKLLIGTMMLAHLNACGWSFCSRITDSYSTQSWQLYYSDGYLTRSDDIWAEYVVALMWSVMTMTTVGYGDIIATNDTERWFTVYMMLIGCAYYGFILGTMAALVASLDSNVKQYHERMDAITSWLSLRNFPKPLFRRVRSYFKHFYELKTAINERHILEQLSASLREDVSVFLIDSIFRKIRIFKTLPKDMQSRLFAALKPEQISGGEILHQVGGAGREMYIIMAGRVMLTNEENNLIFEEFTTGECFGEIYAFQMALFWDVQAVAMQNCEVNSLSSTDIMDIFKDAPDKTDFIHQQVIDLYEAKCCAFQERVNKYEATRKAKLQSGVPMRRINSGPDESQDAADRALMNEESDLLRLSRTKALLDGLRGHKEAEVEDKKESPKSKKHRNSVTYKKSAFKMRDAYSRLVKKNANKRRKTLTAEGKIFPRVGSFRHQIPQASVSPVNASSMEERILERVDSRFALLEKRLCDKIGELINNNKQLISDNNKRRLFPH